MNMTELMDVLAAKQIQVRPAAEPGKLRLQAPKGRTTPEILAAVEAHRPQLLANLLLSASPIRIGSDGEVALPEGLPPSFVLASVREGQSTDRQGELTFQQGVGVVAIEGRQLRYTRRWAGQRLAPADGFLAFDTETNLVDLKREIPRLALASASAGDEESCLIHPDDLASFLLAHRDLRFVGHNVAFDFWVVAQHLRLGGHEEALTAWWAIADENALSKDQCEIGDRRGSTAFQRIRAGSSIGTGGLVRI